MKDLGNHLRLVGKWRDRAEYRKTTHKFTPITAVVVLFMFADRIPGFYMIADMAPLLPLGGLIAVLCVSDGPHPLLGLRRAPIQGWGYWCRIALWFGGAILVLALLVSGFYWLNGWTIPYRRLDLRDSIPVFAFACFSAPLTEEVVYRSLLAVAVAPSDRRGRHGFDVKLRISFGIPPIRCRWGTQSMPARDFHHGAVRNALIKDGWTITHDPYTIAYGDRDVHVDLGAERVLAAERGNEKIAVEIKEFAGASDMHDLEQAIGQFMLYRTGLRRLEPDRKLYLAVSTVPARTLFKEPLTEAAISDLDIDYLVFDAVREEIVEWKS